MPSYAITGASRGIGYECLKQLSEDSSNVVFGIVRSPESVQEKIGKELPGRKNVHIIHGDLSDMASLESAAKYVSATTGGKLDVLIANATAGTVNFTAVDDEFTEDPLKFDEEMLYHFKVNVIGNIHLMHVFTPLIKSGDIKKVVVLSSGFGDTELTVEAGIKMQTPYSVSKAALNMAVAKFHVQYKDEGILFMLISPGLVDTGGYDGFEKTLEFFRNVGEMAAAAKRYNPDWKGYLAPAESARMVLGVIDNATIEKNGGRMISHLGTLRWI